MKTVYKKIQILLIVIVLTLKLIPEANANNAGVADNRFTEAALASDYSQCASLWAVYIATRVATYIACNMSCAGTATAMAASVAAAPFAPAFLTGCLASCPMISDAAALGALYGVYTGYSMWAEEIRQNTKIVNTIDPERPQCGNTSNLDKEGNFAFDGGQEYNQGDGTPGDGSWSKRGPLNNYCYNEDWDHKVDTNPGVYNGGEGKIGVSYMGESPVWIESEDCSTIETSDFGIMLGSERIFCAWTEGDEICVEAVFCTSLGIGDFAPIYGFVGDPTRITSEARRSCGNDPYSNSTIDDFKANKRCECFCCNGSEDYDVCDDIGQGRACKTYNERYYAHCVKRAIPETDLDNVVAPPKTLSAHCSLDVNAGYKEFSFVGKSVRCFSNTISNMYFGKEDVYQFDADGEKLIDGTTGNPIFTSRCIDGAEASDGGCTFAMYRIVQEKISNIVLIILTFWAFFLGVQFAMGQASSKGEMLVHFLKFGIVMYFVAGSGWRDGYYDFLMRGAYELSADFYQVTADGASNTDILDLIDPIDITMDDDSAAALASCSFVDLPIASDEAWEKIQECNFFDGLNSYGVAYAPEDNYLAVLDSIDCKFASYIGFSRNGYYPEIIKVATAVLFDTASGFFFFIAAMVFLYVSIILLLKITFMLVVSVIMINFMIYVSPIMIPLMMLKRTKPIFDKWLATVLGFSLQPFLILVLLSLVILLMDAFFVIYLQGLYDLGVEYKTGFLGISVPTISANYNDAAIISNMLKFMFLLVIVMHMFEAFEKVLSQLSGADSVSSFIKSPDFNAAGKNAGSFAAKKGKAAGKYAATKGRKGLEAGGKAAGKAASAAKGAASSAISSMRGGGGDKGGDSAKGSGGDKGGSSDKGGDA